MIKVSIETLEEVDREFKNYLLLEKNYFSFLHQHFRKENLSLLQAALACQLTFEADQRGGFLDSWKIKNFLLLLLRILKKEGEKQKVKLPKINPEVVNTLVIYFSNKKVFERLEILAKGNPVLASGLITFAERNSSDKEEKIMILFLGLVLLETIQSQIEVDELERHLK